MADETPDTGSTEPTPDATPEPDATPTGDAKDWQADAEKWKSLSRKHEAAFKSVSDELQQLKAQSMTDAEKAIAEAEQRGRDAAAQQYQKQIAEASFKAAAAGRVADVDALLELVDVSKFIAPDGAIDSEAISAAIERFIAAAPQPRKFGSPDAGPKRDDQPAQLTESDVKRLYAERRFEEIAQAKAEGRLNDALGIQSLTT